MKLDSNLIQFWLILFMSTKKPVIIHINREANKDADSLAKEGADRDGLCILPPYFGFLRYPHFGML